MYEMFSRIIVSEFSLENLVWPCVAHFEWAHMRYTVASKPEGWKRNNWTMVSATLSYQSVTGDFDISRLIPKHNRRSLKSGASSGRGLPPRQDLNGDSTDHSLIHRDRKGDAQCHRLQSERQIQATSSFTTKTMARANRSC